MNSQNTVVCYTRVFVENDCERLNGAPNRKWMDIWQFNECKCQCELSNRERSCCVHFDTYHCEPLTIPFDGDEYKYFQTKLMSRSEMGSDWAFSDSQSWICRRMGGSIPINSVHYLHAIRMCDVLHFVSRLPTWFGWWFVAPRTAAGNTFS